MDIPENHLTCVGTSATIGSKEELIELRQYSGKVFDEPFDEDSIITEERLSVGEFLEKSYIKHINIPDKEKTELLKPSSYNNEESYIRKQYKLWFDENIPDDFNDDSWRVALSGHLKEHLIFQNLLRVLDGRVKSTQDILLELQRVSRISENESQEYYENLLNSLCTLISIARENKEGRPFLDIRIQLWIREMRRMVSEVSRVPKICHSDDLSEDHSDKYLPIVHCRDCGSTGWGGVIDNNSNIIPDLRDFYVNFFNRLPTLIFLFPFDEEIKNNYLNGYIQYLCPNCLRLSNSERECPSCDSTTLIRVFVPKSLIQKSGKNISSNDCPFCNSKNGLKIIG